MITYLPPPGEAQVATQITYLLDQGLIPAIEYARQPSPRDHYWNMWKLPLFDARTTADVQAELSACEAAHPDCFITLIGYDRRRQTRAISLVVRTCGLRAARPSASTCAGHWTAGTSVDGAGRR